MKITGQNPFVKLELFIKNIKKGDKTKIEGLAEQATKGDAREISKEDNVILSPKAREIQEAKKLLNALPDIRDEKVAQIKKQIENGTYQIDGERIATRMVKDSLLNELLCQLND